MKKIFAVLSALVILISSCKTPEPPSSDEAETTASANSVTAASARNSAVSTLEYYFTDDEYKQNRTEENTYTEPEPETEPEPKPEPAPLPKIDGSTSTIALDYYFRSKIRDISLWDAKRETIHNKTFEAFENLVNGKTDIVLSVPLAKEQEAYAAEANFEYEAVPVAMEGFVFLVNPKNPVQSLTQAQLRDIYSGKITNWKELGGNDAPIEAYQRNSDSGSQTYMVEFMGDVPLTAAPKSLVQIDMGGVISMFADYDNSINAIGYSVYSYAAAFAANEGTFNFVEVDGVKPSRTTFIDGTYPLLSETYAFYKKDTTDTVVKDYIDLITSEKGQHYVLEAGYIPVMDIEIPAAYTLYEAKGTGAIAPEEINNDDYYLTFDKDTRPRGFLKDTAFEAEIQAWIDEAEEYYENMQKPSWISEYYTSRYKATIQNGYLGISFGVFATGDVGDFSRFYGQSAVFDIVNKRKIENFSDMFYKDANFMPDINKGISAEIMSKTYGGFPIEFFGLCSDFTFDLGTINFKPDNAYVEIPAVFDLRLGNRENSIVSQGFDFTDLITPEFVNKIEFAEFKEKTTQTVSYFEKNGNVYSYYEYSGVENSRDLPENKLIEEMYDAYFAEHGGSTTYKQAYVEEPFIHLYIGSDGPGEVYCTLQHKFITVGDFFKDGFIEHLTIETNTNNGKNKTAEDLYEENFSEDNWYGNALATEEIVKQLTDEYKDDYIIISADNYPELRIDEKWLKNVYRDLPPNE
jgi:ABC-type phosphate transport system substrate-binding protein